MFKKKCNRCGEKVRSSSNFCPSCGFKTKTEENFGMLGKNDFMENFHTEIKLPKGFDMIFNSLVKNLDKQFKDFDKTLSPNKNQASQNPFAKKGGISISISTANGRAPEIKVKSYGNDPKFKAQESRIKEQISPRKAFPKSLKNISNLPREEPSANVRRLSDRVIYEINMPGVKSIKDISINQLENSIEIKAIAGNKAYIKLIPINLPISDYSLSKGKLILELESKD